MRSNQQGKSEMAQHGRIVVMVLAAINLTACGETQDDTANPAETVCTKVYDTCEASIWVGDDTDVSHGGCLVAMGELEAYNAELAATFSDCVMNDFTDGNECFIADCFTDLSDGCQEPVCDLWYSY